MKELTAAVLTDGNNAVAGEAEDLGLAGPTWRVPCSIKVLSVFF
jgi:hypothetical protein